MSKTYKIIVGTLIGVAVVLSAFIGGFYTSNVLHEIAAVNTSPTKAIGGTSLLGANSSETSVTLNDAVTSVYDLMKSKGYQVPSETSATIGALNGLLQSTGDTHSRYMPASEFKSYSEELDGQFAGIGVLLQEDGSRVSVIEVYKGTPASKAGIAVGDTFSVIKGKKSDKWTVEQVQKLVKGKAGTKVTVTMIRPAEKKGGKSTLYTATMTRAMVTYPNTESSIKNGNVGYIRLGQFNNLASSEVEKEIKSVTKKGATSIVLDLRENPGGLLKEAVGTASLFMKSGVVVKTETRGNKTTEVLKTTGNQVTDLPLVILIDKYSASASEIVSGCLQDYGRATLIGTKSYGKGSVQAQYPMSDGSAVILTIEHYKTPKGHDINGIGLTPDITVKMNVNDQMKPKTDIQLIRAVAEAQKLARTTSK